MGMGEPLLNLPSVLRAHEVLNQELGIGESGGRGAVQACRCARVCMCVWRAACAAHAALCPPAALSPPPPPTTAPASGARHITISTVGVPNAIASLAARNLQSTLAVSIHAPTQALRESLVPSAKSYPLDSLMADTTRYFQHTGRRVTFEYTLLAGVNDAPEHARQLAALLRRHDAMRSHVNLIPWNPVDESGARGRCAVWGGCADTGQHRRGALAPRSPLLAAPTLRRLCATLAAHGARLSHGPGAGAHPSQRTPHARAGGRSRVRPAAQYAPARAAGRLQRRRGGRNGVMPHLARPARRLSAAPSLPFPPLSALVLASAPPPAPPVPLAPTDPTLRGLPPILPPSLLLLGACVEVLCLARVSERGRGEHGSIGRKGGARVMARPSGTGVPAAAATQQQQQQRRTERSALIACASC